MAASGVRSMSSSKMPVDPQPFKAATPCPSDLAALLTSVLDSFSLSEIAITPYEIPSPVNPNPWSPFVLFSDSDDPPSPSIGSSSRHKLAIPQKPLFAVYSYACRAYRDLRPRWKDRTSPDDKAILSITRLLLLQNPEHATALNDRRRIISSSTDDDRRLREEVEFVKLVLSVPHHAKASTLWVHLRWLLARLYPPSASLTASTVIEGGAQPAVNGPKAEVSPDVLERELAFALHCCTIYPRNYYAWRHRVWLFTSSKRTFSDRKEGLARAWKEESRRIEDFLRRNPRDHSAATYLAVVVRALRSLEDAKTNVGRDQSAFVEEMLDRYPAVESSWLLARSLHPLEDGEVVRGRLKARAKALWEKATAEQQVVAEEGTLASQERKDTVTAALYAARAYLWVTRTSLQPSNQLDSDVVRSVISARESLPSVDFLSAAR